MRKFKKKHDKRDRIGIIDFIINRRTLIEKLFGILFLISLICIPFIGVNYDLSEYLPASSYSKQGLSLMEEEFGYPGTARVMIGEVSLYEAKMYKDRIEHVDGISMVMWTDTTTDVYQSSLFINYKDIETYYKDGYAVMDVTFEEGDSSKRTHKAIDEIQRITGDKGYFSGSAVQNKSLSETMTREVAIAMVMGVFMIALILCLTTNSWFEPILFLLIMGIAIVINMGTNIFLGRISFLTFSMAAILQLAIAMDYSIFLLHSFTREREAGIEPVQAIANAIRNSVTSVLSSGATTIVGFIVLTFMKFSIGRDMGIVLAKGIVISLLTVLLLMPALILRWSEKVEKSRHRPFVPPFHKFGEKVFGLRKIVLAVVLIIIIPAFTAQSMNQFQYGNGALGSSPGTRVYEDEQEINQRFGRSNLILAVVPNTSIVTEKELTRELEAFDFTKSVTSLAGTLPEGIPADFLPDSLTGQLHTENFARILIFVRSSDESEFAYRCADQIKEMVNRYYPQDAYIVGVTPSTQDIQNIITKDYNFVNILSLLGVALVVLLTFKSGIIPIVVMIPIEVAIFLNMAIPYLTGEKMIYMGYIIVSCLQLGATIDYSILLTNNYLDFRTNFDKGKAAVEAISASALSILTSGMILTTVGYGLYFTSTVAAVGGIGRLVGRGALLSMIMVLVLLPAMLVMFDRAIFNQKKRMEKLERLRDKQRKKVKLTVRYIRQQRAKRIHEIRQKRHKQLKKLQKAMKKKTAASQQEGAGQTLNADTAASEEQSLHATEAAAPLPEEEKVVNPETQKMNVFSEEEFMLEDGEAYDSGQSQSSELDEVRCETGEKEPVAHE